MKSTGLSAKYDYGEISTGDFVIQNAWCANVNGTLTDGTPYSFRTPAVLVAPRLEVQGGQQRGSTELEVGGLCEQSGPST